MSSSPFKEFPARRRRGEESLISSGKRETRDFVSYRCEVFARAASLPFAPAVQQRRRLESVAERAWAVNLWNGWRTPSVGRQANRWNKPVNHPAARWSLAAQRSSIGLHRAASFVAGTLWIPILTSPSDANPKMARSGTD